jgi:predicted nucleic acid-binding protein
MPAEFYDSNVVLYLGVRSTTKAGLARALIESGGHISAQVLNECTNVLRLKRKASWPETRTFLNELQMLLNVWPVTTEIHQSGLRIAERYGFSIYDSFIVAAALAAECNTLWSEDLQHGMVVDGRLRIINPFRDETAP